MTGLHEVEEEEGREEGVEDEDEEGREEATGPRVVKEEEEEEEEEEEDDEEGREEGSLGRRSRTSSLYTSIIDILTAYPTIDDNLSSPSLPPSTPSSSSPLANSIIFPINR